VRAVLRKIDITEFSKIEPPAALGERPKFAWVDIDMLMIDQTYQRDMTKQSRKTVQRIAEHFNWACFEPPMIAPIGCDRFAIINGQHRTTAAMLCGIDKIPCMIVDADEARQAMAFVAINAVVTGVSPLQVHRAAVAGGDQEARKIENICKRSGVRILRNPISTDAMEIGDTTAVRTIYSAVKRFGDDLTEIALTCARAGGAGWINPVFIRGFCFALEATPEWSESRKLLKLVQAMPFTSIYSEAGRIKQASSDGKGGAAGILIAKYLDKQLSRAAA
jgi:hypothetical protein